MGEKLVRDALRILDRYAVTLPTPPDLPAVREALDSFQFDEHGNCRDDVAEVCQQIDDALPTGE